MKHRFLLVSLAFALPLSAQAPARIDLTGRPLARIDSPFTKISGVRELTATRAVATDPMDHAVRIVDFATHRWEQVGRQGRGPAEYQYPSAPVSGPGNTVWVLDPSLSRAIVIGQDGKIGETVSLPIASLGSPPLSDAAGRIYYQGSDFNAQTGGFSDTVPVIRWTPSTERADTVGRVWSGGRVIIKRKTGPASMARSITPFPNMDAWVALPDGRLAMVLHDPFRIDIATSGAGVAHGAPIAVTPLEITAADREAFQAAASQSRSGAMPKNGGTGPRTMGFQYEDADFPPTKPPFVANAVMATPEGEVWVGRSRRAADKTWTYDRFDSAGHPVGQAVLDANAIVVGFGKGVVYVARTNPDDDLVYLEKFKR